QETSTARAMFLGLGLDQQRALLDAVVVCDSFATISDLGRALKRETRWLSGGHDESFLDALEGWWWRRTIVQLTSQSSDPISGDELEEELEELRTQYVQ